MPKENYQDMWLAFTDGSFAVFDVSNIGTGFNTEDVIVLSTYAIDNTNKELVELGLITKEAYKLALAEEDEKWKKRDIERAAEDATIKEDYERMLFESLKNKYS